MAYQLSENVQLKRELELAKNELLKLRVVHDRLGQVGNDLAVCNQKLNERTTKRKRRHSSSPDTRSSSSSNSFPTSQTDMSNNEEEKVKLIKFFTSEINRLTDKLAVVSRERDSVQEELTNERKWRQKEQDLAQASFDNKLEAVSKERDTAQAELKNERKWRQNCSKKREDQLKMFTKLLIEFGADQELLLSLGASCKNYDSHESDESQSYRDLVDQANRTRIQQQQMIAALNEYVKAFEEQRKETSGEMEQLQMQMKIVKQESDERLASYQAQTDYRESVEKLQKVLDRAGGDGDKTAPNNCKKLNAEIEKAGVSDAAKSLTKSIRNALIAIEKNAIQVVSQQANQTLQLRLDAAKKVTDMHLAEIAALVRQKDEALRTVNTLKSEAKFTVVQQESACKVAAGKHLAEIAAVVRQKDEALQTIDTLKAEANSALQYKQVVDNTLSLAKNALRRIAADESTLDTVSAEQNEEAAEMAICAAFDAIVQVCEQKTAEVVALRSQHGDLRNDSAKLREQVSAQERELKKYQSQEAATEKEMKSLQETHSNCQVALQLIRHNLRAAQLRDATTQEELTALRDAHSKCQSSLEEARRRLQEAQSQEVTTQKELRSLRETHSNDTLSLEETRRNLQEVQQALQNSVDQYQRKTEESRATFESSLHELKVANEQLQSEVKNAKDTAHKTEVQLKTEQESANLALVSALKAKTKWFRAALYYQEAASQSHGMEQQDMLLKKKEARPRHSEAGSLSTESVEL